MLPVGPKPPERVAEAVGLLPLPSWTVPPGVTAMLGLAGLTVVVSVLVLPPTSLMATEMAKPPDGLALVYWWLPLTVKLPFEPETSAETSAEVKDVVLPSPQLIVPEKSLVEASVFASVKVAVRVVRVV